MRRTPRLLLLPHACAAALVVHIYPSFLSFASSSPSRSSHATHDVGVIGGGVVGLAVARELAAKGKKVLLIEKEDSVAAGASSGESF